MYYLFAVSKLLISYARIKVIKHSNPNLKYRNNYYHWTVLKMSLQCLCWKLVSWATQVLSIGV